MIEFIVNDSIKVLSRSNNVLNVSILLPDLGSSLMISVFIL